MPASWALAMLIRRCVGEGKDDSKRRSVGGGGVGESPTPRVSEGTEEGEKHSMKEYNPGLATILTRVRDVRCSCQSWAVQLEESSGPSLNVLSRSTHGRGSDASRGRESWGVEASRGRFFSST